MLCSFQLYSKVIQLYLCICSFCNILFHYGYYELLNIVPGAIHWMCACSVVSNSLQPHGLYPSRLLCPWDFPEKNTGVDSHFLLQGIFPTQGSNLCLLCFLPEQAACLPLSHQGSPVLYSRTFSFIRSICKNLQMLNPSSHSIHPPSPSLLATTNLFPKYMSLFLFCRVCVIFRFQI